jgi:hypothetical protein
MTEKHEPAQVPHPWSKEALLAKAQVYAEEMLLHDRDDWKFAFWSSLLLELLARAALGHINPALLADSTKDWNHLFYALGHTPLANKFVPKSIETREVFARLRAICRDFDVRLEGFSTIHLYRRNEELHSGGTPFDNLRTSSWLPLFYAVCAVLMQFMGESLTVLFGEDESEVALSMIKAAKDESAKAVLKSVQARKTIWEDHTDEERSVLSGQADIWAARQAGHRVKCPSCGCNALVSGNAIAPPGVKIIDNLLTETQAFLPSKFECVACGLKVIGLPELHACGLSDPYKATFTNDPVDYYTPEDYYSLKEEVQDMHSKFEPDNNEP